MSTSEVMVAFNIGQWQRPPNTIMPIYSTVLLLPLYHNIVELNVTTKVLSVISHQDIFELLQCHMPVLDRLELSRHTDDRKLWPLKEFLSGLTHSRHLTELVLRDFLPALEMGDLPAVRFALASLRILEIEDSAFLMSRFLQSISLPSCTSCILTALVHDSDPCADVLPDIDDPTDAYTCATTQLPIFQAMLPTRTLAHESATVPYFPFPFEPGTLSISVTERHASVTAIAEDGARLFLEVRHAPPTDVMRLGERRTRRLLRAALQSLEPVFSEEGQSLVHELNVICDLGTLVNSVHPSATGQNSDHEGSEHKRGGAEWCLPLSSLPGLRSVTLTNFPDNSEAPDNLAMVARLTVCPQLEQLTVKCVRPRSMEFLHMLSDVAKQRAMEGFPLELLQLDFTVRFNMAESDRQGLEAHIQKLFRGSIQEENLLVYVSQSGGSREPVERGYYSFSMSSLGEALSSTDYPPV